MHQALIGTTTLPTSIPDDAYRHKTGILWHDAQENGGLSSGGQSRKFRELCPLSSGGPITNIGKCVQHNVEKRQTASLTTRRDVKFFARHKT